MVLKELTPSLSAMLYRFWVNFGFRSSSFSRVTVNVVEFDFPLEVNSCK